MGSVDEQTTYFLVTGANDGLGLGTCKRLLTTFLTTRPASHRIHLVASTRSASKSAATLTSLRAHLHANARLKAAADARATLSSVELDLKQLLTVRAAVAQLAKELPRLDVVLCNAGISGPQIFNWPKAFWNATIHPIEAVTWPRFVTAPLGITAPAQFPASSALRKEEPRLGDIFAANVFGHYLLVQGLASLLSGTAGRPAGRVIWVSTLDTEASFFTLDDIQCFNTRFAYQSSKRLTDLLALTSDLPAAHPSVSSFFAALPAGASPPVMYLSHPSVVGTDIFPLGRVMKSLKICAFYVARLLGSPWHAITVETGAAAGAWLALTPAATLEGLEERDGKGKWGSGTDRWGGERVLRTEVDGWGWGGKTGQEERWAPGRKGRSRHARDLRAEDREKFVEDGTKAWKEMERLRGQWEELLVRAEKEIGK